MTTKYKIGDVVNDTSAVGDCKVVDILISPTSGDIIYGVESLDDHNKFWLMECELDNRL